MMISELGRLSGAFWGAVVAVALLEAGLVDCEGWDLFALWKKRRKLAQDWEKRGRRLEHERMVLRSSLKASARASASHDDREDDGARPSPEEAPARPSGASGR